MATKSKFLGEQLRQRREEIQQSLLANTRSFYPVCINGISSQGAAMVRFIAPRHGFIRNIYIYLGAVLPPGPMEKKSQIKVWVEGGTHSEVYEVAYNRPIKIDREIEMQPGTLVSLNRITDNDLVADITLGFEFG